MAVGRVVDSLIIQIGVDLQKALSDLKRVQDEFNKTTGAASSFVKNINASVARTSDAFSGLTKGFSKGTGIINKATTSMGRVKGEMDLAAQRTRELSKSVSALGPATSKVDGLRHAFQSLAQKGVAQLDRISGGMVTQMGGIASQFGLTAKAAGAVGIALVAVGAAWKYAIEPGIRFNMMLEQQETAFSVMLGTAEKAQALMARLKVLSLTTPIGLDESTAGTKQLLAYGFAQEEIVDNMKMLATVAKAVNVPLQDVVYVYGTLRAQGRAYTRDLMQFAMRGIPIYEYLAQVMKVSVKEIKALTESGAIGFKEVETAIKAMTSSGGRLAGMLEKSMTTTAGKAEVIKNTWKLVTAEMTKNLMPVIKAMQESILRIVKHFDFWKMLIEVIGVALVAVGAVIMYILEAINWIVYAFMKLVDAAVWLGKAINKLAFSGLDKMERDSARVAENLRKAKEEARAAYDAMVKTMPQQPGDVVDYGVPLQDPRALAGNPYAAYTKGLKEVGKAMEETAQRAALTKYYMDTRTWKFDATHLNADVKAATDAQKVYLIEVGKAAENMSRTLGFSWDKAARLLAASLSLSESALKTLLAEGSKYINFFDYFQNNLDKSGVEDQKRTKNAIAGANLVYNTLSNNLERTKSLVKELGLSTAEGTAGYTLIEEAAKSFSDTLWEQIQVLSADSAWLENYAGAKDMLRELMRLYEELQKTRVKSAKAETDISASIQKYMEERAAWLNIEDKALNDRLQNMNAARSGESSMGRILDSISYKYVDIYNDLLRRYEVTKELTKEQYDLLSGIAGEEEKHEKAAASLEEQKRTYGILIGSADNFYEAISLQKGLYNLQAEALLQIGDLDERRLKQIQLEAENAEKTTAIYENQYKVLLEGSDKFYEKQKKIFVNLFSDEPFAGGPLSSVNMKQALKTGGFKNLFKEIFSPRAMEDVKEATKAAISMGLQGSEVGNVLGGGNPIAMMIASLVEFAMSIENVNKLLNPFATVLEGVRAMIEGPINGALQPLVNILIKVGEVVGAVLLPFIDYFGWVFDTLADIIMPILEVLKMLFQALRPVIFLFLKLQDPVIMLLSCLNEALGLSQESIELESDRIEKLKSLYDQEMKSLQDLYNVGALSGAEYEQRLAELRERYGQAEPTATGNAPANQFMSQMAAGIAVIEEWCTDFYNAIIVPLTSIFNDIFARLAPIFSKLGEIFQNIFAALAPVFSSLISVISSTFGALASALSPILTAIFSILSSFLNPFLDVINVLVAALIPALDSIMASFFSIGEILGFIFEVLGGIVGTIAGWIAEFMASPFVQSLLAFAAAIVAGSIKLTFDQIANVLGIIQAAIEIVKGVLEGVFAIFEWVWALLNGDREGMGRAVQKMKEALDEVWKAIVDLGRDIGNVFIDAINFLIGCFESLIRIFNKNWTAALIPRLATGTGEVPYDTLAQLHKGEAVIPAKFMDDIRNGTLALSGGGRSGAGNTVIVHVYGNAIYTRDLAREIAAETNKQQRRGYI